jgi:hypothetical protein
MYLAWAVRRGGWKPLVATAAVIALLVAGGPSLIPRLRTAWSGRGPLPLADCGSAAALYPYAGRRGSVEFDIQVVDPPGHAIRIRYGQPAADAFWGVGFTLHRDLSAYGALRLNLRSGNGHPFRVQLVEEGGEMFARDVAPPLEQGDLTLPFASFEVRKDFNGGQVNGMLDLGRIRAMEILQQEAGFGSDTLWISAVTAVPLSGTIAR